MFNKFNEYFINPVSSGEDQKRKEYILNVLLAGSIGFTVALCIVTLVHSLMNSSEESSPVAVFVAAIFFVTLLILSRRGYVKIASILFVSSFFLLSTYPAYKWGILLPQGILTYSLIIVMSGILVGSKFAFSTALLSLITIALIHYWEANNVIAFNTDWMSSTGGVDDVVSYGFTFGIIALVSWLSNREIEKSLTRARRSEAELKIERDSLDIKVKERTKELEESQKEKIQQLEKFAEFGQVTSTFLHDVANPLTAASLNLELAKDKNNTETITRAREALEHMERYVESARRQLKKQKNVKRINVKQEVESALKIFQQRIKENDIKLEVSLKKNLFIKGDAALFTQIISNLLSNAIDALESTGNYERIIEISTLRKGNQSIISVSDNGEGIPKANINKIFEPFITTKNSEKGTGLGLSIVKRIVEEEFGGQISATSNKLSTTFLVNLPNHEKYHESTRIHTESAK